MVAQNFEQKRRFALMLYTVIQRSTTSRILNTIVQLKDDRQGEYRYDEFKRLERASEKTCNAFLHATRCDYLPYYAEIACNIMRA